jgi:Zn-dependent peptidase ImmA (M78 family)
VPGPLESADDIKKIADRLLRSADAYGRFPTPVDDIIAAAKLSQADDYVLDDSLINKAPAYLRQMLRSAKRKIQGLVDRRERVVHVAPAIENEGKRRFVLLHETIHAASPHQQDLLYADDHETLSPTTNRLFEREANFGSAELLFQRDLFTREAKELEISTATIWLLAERYGSSFHAALRRYAETHPAAVAAIVLGRTPSAGTPPRWQREEVMATTSWTEQFGAPAWPRSMSALTYPFLAALEHVELDCFALTNVRGESLEVRVDACQTPYKSFVLLWIPQKARLRKPLRVRIASQVVP